MGVVSLLLHADFGRNDHREGALHFIFVFQFFTYKYVRFWTKNDDFQNQSLAVQALNLWVQLDYHKILEEILILWIYLKVEIKSQYGNLIYSAKKWLPGSPLVWSPASERLRSRKTDFRRS